MATEIPKLNELKRTNRALNDIGNSLERNVNAMGKWARDVRKSAEEGRASFKDLGNAVEAVSSRLKKLSLGMLGMGFNFIIDSIQKIYELKERWARVTGMVTMRLGALTPNMSRLAKTSRSWQGTIRSLTGDFEAGATMFTEYAATLETTGKKVAAFDRSALSLARGFDLGGKGAGELVKSFRAIGETAGGMDVQMGLIVRQSKLLDVNTQSLVKELSESGDMMARFGKEGTRSLITSAIYLKQFNISLKSTDRLMDTFDRFDSATEASARLNIVFGTTISSMDMLLKQDPAERIETVRQELLSQGKTWDKMSYMQRRVLTQSLGISEREAAMMLDQQNAHVSLADFRQKAAKEQMTEQKAQKLMQTQLRKTSQTLFDFGHAMDRITVAIGNMIRPLLEALGLVKSSDKEWKSFGQIMEAASIKIAEVFNAMAKSPQWIALMEKLAQKLKDIAKWFMNLKGEDVTRAFDKVVSGAKSFFKYSLWIIGIWTGAKALGMINNLTKAASMMGGIMGKGSIGRITGRTAAGAVGGAGIGMMTGGMTLGGAVGGAAGGAAGALLLPFLGPFGSMLGAAAGGYVGEFLQDLIGESRKSSHQKKLDKIMEERADNQRDHNIKMARFDRDEIHARLLRKKRENENTVLDRRVAEKKKSKTGLDEQDVKEMKKRIDSARDLGVSSKKLDELYYTLSEGLVLNSSQLATFNSATKKASDKMDALATATDALIKQKEAENQTIIDVKKDQFDLNELEQEKKLSGIRAEEMLLRVKTKGVSLIGNLSSDEIEQRIKQTEREEYDATLGNNLNTKSGRARLKELNERKENLKALLAISKKREGAEQQLEEITSKKLKFENDSLEMQRGGRILANVQALEGVSEYITSRTNALIEDGMEKKAANRQAMIEAVEKEHGIAGKHAVEKFLNFDGTRFSRGGIVSSPTRALIGESGPEAVIPLRGLARGKIRSSSGSGSVERRLINYATGTQSDSGGKTIVVAGDVYLDGKKVGRHLVREAVANSTI